MRIKTLFTAGIAAMCGVLTAGMSSCANDVELTEQKYEGEVSVTLTATMPEQLHTYASGSELSGLKNLEGEGLSVRYIMEVYPKGSSELEQRAIIYKPLVANGNYRSVSFDAKLPAMEYDFVCWSDIVKNVSGLNNDVTIPGIDKSEGFYGNRYFVSNLDGSNSALAYATGPGSFAEGSITKISTGVLGDKALQAVNGEMNDGYCGKTTIDLLDNTSSRSVVLKRPFAKLRIIATDGDVLAQQNINIEDVRVTPVFNGNVPSQYDVISGTATGNCFLSDAYSSNVAYSSETGSEKTVGVFYCLPAPSANNLTLTVNIANSDLFSGIEKSASNVPLVANKLTTVKMSLFSKSDSFQISLSDEFEDNGSSSGTGNEEKPTDPTVTDPVDDPTPSGETVEVSSESGFDSALTGGSQTIRYTAKVTESVFFDFGNKYAEKNNAVLKIYFTDIADDIPVMFMGSIGPKEVRVYTPEGVNIRLSTSAKNTYSVLYLNDEEYQ